MDCDSGEVSPESFLFTVSRSYPAPSLQVECRFVAPSLQPLILHNSCINQFFRRFLFLTHHELVFSSASTSARRASGNGPSRLRAYRGWPARRRPGGPDGTAGPPPTVAVLRRS